MCAKPILLTPDLITELYSQKQLVLVDKPEGWTSHDIISVMRGKTGIKRIGHAGTLDPIATGLLIVLVGREATRLQDIFMHMDKTYEFTAQLGVETDTFDRTGQVVNTWPWEDIARITQLNLEKALKNFLGTYEQQVPAFSAVKINGQKLYDLARRGKKVKPPTRVVHIHTLRLSECVIDHAAKTLHFSCVVECGSGTYVRSLAHDVGQALRLGATVTSLRRTRIGQFDVQDAQIWESDLKSNTFSSKKNSL